MDSAVLKMRALVSASRCSFGCFYAGIFLADVNLAARADSKSVDGGKV